MAAFGREGFIGQVWRPDPASASLARRNYVVVQLRNATYERWSLQGLNGCSLDPCEYYVQRYCWRPPRPRYPARRTGASLRQSLGVFRELPQAASLISSDQPAHGVAAGAERRSRLRQSVASRVQRSVTSPAGKPIEPSLAATRCRRSTGGGCGAGRFSPRSLPGWPSDYRAMERWQQLAQGAGCSAATSCSAGHNLRCGRESRQSKALAASDCPSAPAGDQSANLHEQRTASLKRIASSWKPYSFRLLATYVREARCC